MAEATYHCKCSLCGWDVTAMTTTMVFLYMSMHYNALHWADDKPEDMK